METIAIIWLVIISIVAYLIGSCNSSIIISKCIGTDIRQHGSGNAGATNMLRIYGKRIGVLALVLDAGKGVLAVGIGMITEHYLRLHYAPNTTFLFDICKYICGIFVVAGHNYPVFFGFRGGKGIATSGAVIFMLDWRIGLITLILALTIMAITRYVSLGSILAAVLYPIITAIFTFWIDINNSSRYIALVTSVIIGALAVYRHHANIGRLIKGTESKLGQKSQKTK